jgi:hypothetical protein
MKLADIDPVSKAGAISVAALPVPILMPLGVFTERQPSRTGGTSEVAGALGGPRKVGRCMRLAALMGRAIEHRHKLTLARCEACVLTPRVLT